MIPFETAEAEKVAPLTAPTPSPGIESLSFCFLGFAIGRTISSLLSGQFIDKYSAVRLLPLYLIPFFFGLLLLLIVDHIYVGFIYLLLTGVTVGLGGQLKQPQWSKYMVAGIWAAFAACSPR